MPMNKQFIIITIIVATVVAVAIWIVVNKKEPVVVTNFEECVAAGNSVMESYPRQCRHGDETFVEAIACTQEAMLCPDGVTYVGRTGPACEFASCPSDLTQEEKETIVASYITENISVLSPEPEVLGGTFYVTDIRFTGTNSGVVEYEDGHIALTADFTFTIGNSGTIEVELMNVRESGGN